jgi:Glycosyltransferase family 87
MSRRAISAAVLAVALGAWLLAAHVDLYPHQRLTDLPVYESAARNIEDGRLPYRDFAFEYPPLAAVLIMLARLLPVPFSTGFSILMFVALCATALGVLASAAALRLTPRRQLAAGLVVALLPLLLGDWIATRYDLAVAAVLAWFVWAAVTTRWRTAWTLLALAVALKLVPIVLVPALLVWHRRHHDGRTALTGAGLAAVGVIGTFVPFLVLSPAGIWHMFSYHLDRPLQIESLGSAYMLGLHALAGIGLHVETTFGSQNLVGNGPQVIAAICTTLTVLGIVAVWRSMVLAMRHSDAKASPHIWVGAVATTLVLVVATGKVLSPQFLLWLVPGALLVRGPFGRWAFVTTVGVLLATQLYFPAHYWDLVGLSTGAITLLVVRDALLVVLVALLWPRPDYATPMLNGVIDRANPSLPASTSAP